MPRPPHDQLNWNALSMQDILTLAIKDEEEARDYYRHAAELAGDLNTRRMFQGLAEMEQGHADLLTRELNELNLQHDLEVGMAD
jgi:rubrerythrin